MLHSATSVWQPIAATIPVPRTTSSICSTVNFVKPTASAQLSALALPASQVTPITTETAYSAPKLTESMVHALPAAPKLKAPKSAALTAN